MAGSEGRKVNYVEEEMDATSRLYEQAFGELPAEYVAARCQGKACHMKENCRCR